VKIEEEGPPVIRPGRVDSREPVVNRGYEEGERGGGQAKDEKMTRREKMD
jgi:hypothetical protein